jgi:AcrR family transcriptional regulator
MSGPDRGGAAARARILEAARTVFATAGLEGASLRAIAAEAGYTPAALYFHFASREAIYAELLRESLEALAQALAPARDFRAAAMALYDFYAARPQELWLGLCLRTGGPAPRGLGAELDPALNARLLAALTPLTAGARALGEEALAARAFAQVVGLVALAETRRLRLFGRDPRALMIAELDAMLFGKAPPPR